MHAYPSAVFLSIFDADKNSEREPSTSAKTPVSIETFCLTLPGRELHLPSLLLAKKFRNRGNKEGALTSFRKLENEGFGTLVGENPVINACNDVLSMHVCTCTCIALTAGKH